MPRTKSTRNADDRPPWQKLATTRSILDRIIFFGYYDGITTNGTEGFDPKLPPGSVFHKRSLRILDAGDHMTDAAFRSRAKKMATMAREFIAKEEIPAEAERPVFDASLTVEEMLLQIYIQEQDQTTTPEDKLGRVTNALELFVFFEYYDGFKTEGRIGINPRLGVPGSVCHKRSYKILDGITSSAFWSKGKELAELAQEFISKGIAPREDFRPNIPREPPVALQRVAAEARYGY